MVATPNRIKHKNRVRISKSGQITLPARVRAELGVKAGEQVDIIQRVDGVVEIEATRPLTIDELAGSLGPPPQDRTLSEYIEEIDRTPMVRRVYEESESYDPD